MNTAKLPVAADEHYREYVQNVAKMSKESLTRALPTELYEKNTLRSMSGFFVSYALYIGCIVGTAYSPHWTLSIILLIGAGLGGWGLHCIAHDCGHHSFSNSKRLNGIIGHIALLPLIYPFHAWRHVHNMHHGATNHLELDTDWRPVSREIYKRMSFTDRMVYIFTRSIGFWAGTIRYWWVSGFRPGFYPQKAARQEVRRSMLFVIVAMVIYFPVLIYFTGWSGFLLYFVLPWLSTHAWFSTTTLMHHVATDLPFLDKEHWSLNGSRMLLTTDYYYPKWLLWLTHNISIHAAHHVAPTVPYYNLPKAQEILRESYPGLIREKPFSWKVLWQIVSHCHFYDPKTGYYEPYWQRKGSAPKTSANTGA